MLDSATTCLMTHLNKKDVVQREGKKRGRETKLFNNRRTAGLLERIGDSTSFAEVCVKCPGRRESGATI